MVFFTVTGSFNGSLSTLRASELGSHVVKEVIQRAQLKPDDVQEVILGHVLTAGTEVALSEVYMLLLCYTVQYIHDRCFLKILYMRQINIHI